MARAYGNPGGRVARGISRRASRPRKSATAVTGVLVAGVLVLMMLAAPGRSSASSGGKCAEAHAYTKCMRSHGVRNFPNPRFWANGSITYDITQSVGTNPHFTSASRACQHLLIP